MLKDWGLDSSYSLIPIVLVSFSGKIELREDTVETLLSTACLLQLSEVVEACCGFLMKQLHPSNCIGIRLFADSQGCANLLKVAHNYTTVSCVGSWPFSFFRILSPFLSLSLSRSPPPPSICRFTQTGYKDSSSSFDGDISESTF